MIKKYYDVCADIDCHNRQRQDDMELERIVKTETWWERVCMSVFGVIAVDTEKVYSEVVHQSEVDEIRDDLFKKLTHEMIFNDIDSPASRRRPGLDRHSPVSPVTGTSPQNSVDLIPPKKKKRVINIFFQVFARSRVAA